MEEAIASFQRGGGGGGAVRSLYAVNVVIPMIIFFCSFHNDTSVVWISKTVSIDANYLLKLETFLIHFDEGKGTCIRSSEAGQLFPRKKKKKIYSELRQFIKINLFGFLSRHETESKQAESQET